MSGFKASEVIKDVSDADLARVKRTCFPIPVKTGKKIVYGYPVAGADIYVSHTGGREGSGHLRPEEIAEIQSVGARLQKSEGLKLKLQVKLILKKIEQLADDPANETLWLEYADLAKKSGFEKGLISAGRDIYEYAASKSGGRFSIGKKALEDTPTADTPGGEGGK